MQLPNLVEFPYNYFVQLLACLALWVQLFLIFVLVPNSPSPVVIDGKISDQDAMVVGVVQDDVIPGTFIAIENGNFVQITSECCEICRYEPDVLNF